MKEKLKNFLKDKKILILGYGREGHSTVRLLDEIKSSASYKILDPVPKIIPDDLIDENEIIIKSPGIPLIMHKVSSSKQKDFLSKVTSQADLLLKFSECPVIGITGTKGKSTTSSLIHSILLSQNLNSRLVGNIGIPPLDIYFEEDEISVVVCEFSCHQLEFVSASPEFAVLLNIFPEHLDHYENFDSYKNAKENIFKFQKDGDFLIRPDLEKKDIINYNSKLRGEHNFVNISTAIETACAFCEKYSVSFNLQKAISVAENFSGLSHRTELFFTDEKGREFVNDSISTIPEAVIQALLAFPETDTLIVGGMDRNIPYRKLYDFLPNYVSLKNLIVIPDSGVRVAYEIKEIYPSLNFQITHCNDLKDATHTAFKLTEKRLMFSPAAASYGFFKNFEERGDFFKNEILRLAKNYININ